MTAWHDVPPWAPSWVPGFDRPRSIVALRWFIGVVLALGLLAFVVKGADNPPDPHLAPPGALAVTSGTTT